MLCARQVIFHNFFFFNDTATTEIYTLSLHDALPISIDSNDNECGRALDSSRSSRGALATGAATSRGSLTIRSEEHTSELQSRQYLVCRLLLEKKNNNRLFHLPTTLSIQHRNLDGRVY